MPELLSPGARSWQLELLVQDGASPAAPPASPRRERPDLPELRLRKRASLADALEAARLENRVDSLAELQGSVLASSSGPGMGSADLSLCLSVFLSPCLPVFPKFT